VHSDFPNARYNVAKLRERELNLKNYRNIKGISFLYIYIIFLYICNGTSFYSAEFSWQIAVKHHNLLLLSLSVQALTILSLDLPQFRVITDEMSEWHTKEKHIFYWWCFDAETESMYIRSLRARQRRFGDQSIWLILLENFSFSSNIQITSTFCGILYVLYTDDVVMQPCPRTHWFSIRSFKVAPQKI
jgi:hypothetical protein